MEVSLYPFEFMRITQRHDEGNHLAHYKPNTNYSDKPWDEACKDSGKSYFTPFNDYIVVEKLGNQKSGCSVRLVTKNKVKIPYQKEPVRLELTLTHMDESNFNKVKVNDILKAGSRVLLEGTSGSASGNHFHITANIGDYYGFKKNTNGKYVFCYKKSLIPSEAFYVDTTKTEIINAKKYEFVGVNYKIGMSGRYVDRIDLFLSGLVSGVLFGEYTKEVLKVFQSKNGLKATGEVDLKTFEKLIEKGANL